MEPEKEHYQAVVIGGGIGGLTTGALLAREGLDVLVIDRRPGAGGVCTNYNRGGFQFDVGPHLLSGGAENGTIRKVLKILGTDEHVKFLPVNPIARVLYPDFTLEIPPDYKQFAANISEKFPHSEAQLLMLFREMEEVYEEINSMPSSFGIWDYLKVPLNQPVFMKYPNLTLHQMISSFVTDPRVKALVSSLWTYFGLPPERISAVFWSAVTMSYFKEGGFYPEGGIGKVADALLKGLKRCGGHFLPSAQVHKISVKRGKIQGVWLKNVERMWTPEGRLRYKGTDKAEGKAGENYFIKTHTVISNIDPRNLWTKLVEGQYIPGKYLHRLRKILPSLSVLKLNIGVDLKPSQLPLTSHDTLIFNSFDFNSIYRNMMSSIPEAPCGITFSTLTDKSQLSDHGSALSLWNYTTLKTADKWRGEAGALAERIIKNARWIIPGIEKSISTYDIITPETLRYYAGSEDGAAYGWAFLPTQMGFNRLQPRTPLKNLYLVGHWTTPGAGIAGVILSAMNTANIVIRESGKLYLWRKSA